MGEAKKKVAVTAAKPFLFSAEMRRDRRAEAMVGALVALAIIASFLTGVLMGGLFPLDRQLAIQTEPPVINVYVEAGGSHAAAATPAEAVLPTAVAAIVEPIAAACPEGTSQIPEWAPGLCGDEAFLALAAGQAQGEVDGPGSGVLVILSENAKDHCYGDEATFWPLTPGVNGSIAVARDELVTVVFPEGRWGLGGATECTP